MSNYGAESVVLPAGVGIFDGPFYSGDAYVGAGRIPSVGAKVELRDGRIFRFVRVKQTNGDIAKGAPVCINQEDAAAVGRYDITAAAAAASETLQLTTTSLDLTGAGAGIIAANFFAGGKIVIPTGAAAGVYGIKSHTAGTGSVGIILTLDRPLAGAATTSHDAWLLPFEDFNCQKYTTNSLVVKGFAVNAFTAATNTREEYGWIQTRGVGAVKIKTNTSIAIGSNLVLGDADGLILEAAHAKQVLASSLAIAAAITNADIVPAYIRCE
jgi:hypothetical protein